MLGQVGLSQVELIYARYTNDSQMDYSPEDTVTFA
jgi:hypothetical protein